MKKFKNSFHCKKYLYSKVGNKIFFNGDGSNVIKYFGNVIIWPLLMKSSLF